MGQNSAKMFLWCSVPTAEINSSCVFLTEDETEELIQRGTNYRPTDNVKYINWGDMHSLSHSTALLAITICTLGFLGNSLVIWLLGFCIKRNPFTTYVLNLSIADLGFLVTRWLMYSPVHRIKKEFLVLLLIDLSQFMYNASQYFLTVISVDRCVAVFFPLWYRCHRPKHLSTIVCALIWVISFLPPGIGFMAYLNKKPIYHIIDCQVIVNGFLCLPLMTISGLMLVKKVHSKIKQQKQRKLLIMILLNVLFFFIFSFPMNVAYICYYLFKTVIDILEFLKVTGACLNSSINPIIYGLVVRPKKGGFMKNLKTMLQSLFSGEELSVEPREKKVEIPLE